MKNPKYTRILWFFLKTTVHKWERRDSGSGPNDTKPSALKKGGLGAYFEPSSKLSSCLSILLRLIELTVFLKIFYRFQASSVTLATSTKLI